MKKFLFASVAALGLIATAPAHATWYYVGSWDLANAPQFTSSPPVYSGLTAAALLFGGSPINYAISTVDSDPANINFMSWDDSWGIHPPVATAENYSYSDPSCGGLYCGAGATSAYVADYANVSGPGVYINYAFTDIPEPGSLGVIGTGLVGLLVRRRR